MWGWRSGESGEVRVVVLVICKKKWLNLGEQERKKESKTFEASAVRDKQKRFSQ